MLFNAAFESGGIKGLAYIGVLKYLEEKGIKINEASGSSVGALFAALLKAGYKSGELQNEIENVNINKLLKKNSFFSAIKNFGFNNIDNLEIELNRLLNNKGISRFRDVKKGNDYLLKIAVTDYSNKKSITLPNDFKYMGYNPDNQLISKAVSMSCSVPLFYSVYKHNDNMYGDGGIVNKFPINVLNKSLPILAFKISKDNRKIPFYKNYSDDKLREMNIHVIRINTLDINSLNFKKGFERRFELYKNGYIAVKNYFEKYNKEML